MATTTHHPLTNYPVSRRMAASPRRRAAAWLGRMIARWRARAAERRAFAVIEERELHDMGLSRWEVEQELRRPFWRG